MREPSLTRAESLLDPVWRAAYRAAFPLARAWWRMRRPPHLGALVAIRTGGDLLLVRASYRQTWSLPGGGVKKGETPEQAARRELMEEIGLETDVPLRLAKVLTGVWEGRPERVHFFELRLPVLPALRLDNREIVQARLVTAQELPAVRLTGPVGAYLRIVATSLDTPATRL